MKTEKDSISMGHRYKTTSSMRVLIPSDLMRDLIVPFCKRTLKEKSKTMNKKIQQKEQK